MSSQRRIIRNDIVTRLLNKTTAGDRVYPSRSEPLPEEKLPAILVHIPRERGQNIAENQGIPNFRTTSSVLIQAVVKDTGGEQVQETLDLLAEDIERILFTDPDFVKRFSKIGNLDTQVGTYTQGALELASVGIQVDVEFDDDYPPVISDDFATLRLKTDVIDPAADPNVHPPDGQFPEGYGGYPGPDKRIEVEAEFEVEIP